MSCVELSYVAMVDDLSVMWCELLKQDKAHIFKLAHSPSQVWVPSWDPWSRTSRFLVDVLSSCLIEEPYCSTVRFISRCLRYPPWISPSWNLKSVRRSNARIGSYYVVLHLPCSIFLPRGGHFYLFVLKADLWHWYFVEAGLYLSWLPRWIAPFMLHEVDLSCVLWDGSLHGLYRPIYLLALEILFLEIHYLPCKVHYPAHLSFMTLSLAFICLLNWVIPSASRR